MRNVKTEKFSWKKAVSIKAPLLFGVTAAALWAASACSGEGLPGEETGEVYEEVTGTTSFQNGVFPTSAYAGTTDATIKQSNPTTNFGNATTCEVDGDDGSGVDKSCLLQWSISDIPAGSTVTSATITFQIVDGTSNTYDIYEIRRAWSESSVTWNSPWATAGAMASTDRGSVVGTVTGSKGARTAILNAAGIAVVQAWVDGTSNSGLIVASTTNANGLDFASSEASTASSRPRLTVTYTLPSGGTGGTGGSGATGGTGGSGATGGTGGTGGSGGGTATDPNLLVAFIGDQGNGSNASAVLNLIKNEGAVATVHNGDFDYSSNATAWDDRINSILGANYPYFAVVGNHDAPAWNATNGYASKIAARLSRVPEMNCTGNPGVKSTCNFRGLFLVQSCVGTNELSSSCGSNSAEQVAFLRDSLAANNAIFSVCSWHKNQNDMQVGTKGNEVGWNAYRECMNGGAIISTGHEHSYARTRTLTDLGNSAGGHGVTGAFNLVELAAGRDFVFVSGLGGNSVRAFDTGGHNDDTWWASYYTSDRWFQNGTLMSGSGTYGATFIRFNVGGNPRQATAYFKDVNGRIADQFTIQAL